MLKYENHKWVKVTDWTTDQWEKFEAAARAQAAIDDAIAAAAWPDALPEDWVDIDKQCHAMYGRSLGALYNQLRAAGRVDFLEGQTELAAKTAGAGGWFGEKVLGIKDGDTSDPKRAEPVTIIIDK